MTGCLLAAACSPESRPLDCEADADCPDTEECLDHNCVPKPECTIDGDCEIGEICLEGNCVSGCRTDRDCPAGFTCLPDQGDHGVCAECQADGDCDTGEICENNACREGCRLKTDCPSGVCNQQTLTCVECIDDNDCADVDLPRCDNYVCIPECVVDADCTGQDEVCVDNHCQTIAQECDLRVIPAHPIEFGTVRIGSAVNLKVRLQNEGAAACAVSGIEVRDSLLYASDFVMINAPLVPLVVDPRGQPGAVVDVELSFAPAEEGQHQATFWVTSDDPDLLIGDGELACILPSPVTGQACIPLTGKGVVLDVEAIPGQVDFDQVEVGCSSAQQVVRVYNLGEEVTVTEVSLADALSPHFEISNVPVLPLVLSPDASFAVVVLYHPQTPGPHNNRLVIGFLSTDLPDLEIPLQGVGTNNSAATDVFHLPADVKVDVLWVVDNSGSMQPKQDALADNFGSFIAWAQALGVNYHIGVTSTDMDDPGHSGKLQGTIRVIDPSTPNPNEVFGDNVRLGTIGSGIEMGLAASHAALSPPLVTGYNAGFLREDAKLTIIYVSDEEDQSPGEVEFYVQYFLNLKGTAEWVTLSAICGDLPSGCTDPVMGDAVAAPRYHAVLNRTGGAFHSICQTDWSGLMTDLGADAFAPIRTFPLSRPADPATIAVTVDTNPVPEAGVPNGPNGWTYIVQTNAVWFGDNVLPPNGSVVRITYTALCL